MANHNDFGILAEELATEHLRAKGYKIRERNWTIGKKEIDIIAFKDDTLVVVEVKARSSDYFMEPHEAVTRKKQRNIITAANAYILQHAIDFDTRFDIVSIVGAIGQHTIEHIEDAYIPML